MGISPTVRQARLEGARIEHLHVLRAARGVELRRERPAERRANRRRGLPDVDAQDARAIAIELDVDLRRELLAPSC